MKKESKLEEKVNEGLYGKKEIKREEKNRFLGEFKERVIRYLTYDQVLEKGTYPEILAAIRHPEAKKLVINRKVELDSAWDYIKLAKDNNLLFKKIDSPDLKGDVALVVVSDHKVEVEEKEVISRKEKLQNKGISDLIIDNVGAHLCAKCWNELEEKAEEELVNYKKIGLLAGLLGTKCICKN